MGGQEFFFAVTSVIVEPLSCGWCPYETNRYGAAGTPLEYLVPSMERPNFGGPGGGMYEQWRNLKWWFLLRCELVEIVSGGLEKGHPAQNQRCIASDCSRRARKAGESQSGSARKRCWVSHPRRVAPVSAQLQPATQRVEPACQGLGERIKSVAVAKSSELPPPSAERRFMIAQLVNPSTSSAGGLSHDTPIY